jgi:molybdenum-dependent DNA-binding transcriptional regulator ModE
MSAPDSFRSPKSRPKIRRDGWTAERQLGFLDALARTRSVSKAAASVGMSRESAYRLRERIEGALFAALWDGALQVPAGIREGHIAELSDGRLMRLLGNHYRRESGGFCFGRTRTAE